jgi:GNAT superfamily N-acetyltransferase
MIRMTESLVTVATEEQRALCDRLAYEVYCEEMGILREDADHEHRVVRSTLLDQCHVLCALHGGDLVGTVSILTGDPETGFPPEYERDYDIPRYAAVVPRTRMVITLRFVVREQYRSTVLPFRMITELGRYAISQGALLAFCDCQPNLLKLYQELGFSACAPVFDVPGFGVMVPLLLCFGEVARLRAIRSPLVRQFPGVKDDPELAAKVRDLLPVEMPAATLADSDGELWSALYGVLSGSANEASVFAGFAESELTSFLERGRILSCQGGQQVIVEGQAVRTAFVVIEGAVEVRFRNQTLARVEAGGLVGEFAFLLNSRRTADVFAAAERVRLLVLDESLLQRLLAAHPDLAARFFLNVSKALALRLLRQSGQAR